MSDAIEATTPRSILTREALKAESEQRQLLAQYVKQQMVEGSDFGKIPGTDKPTLLKPGAEKLTDLFRCTPKFHLVKIEEDFDKGFFNYVFRVRLHQRDANAVLAEGFGSANSREGRYRWREAQRKCPKCQKPTIFASKHDPGFYCWAKKGGCGAKFGPTDAAVIGQVAGRVENDDVATLANTILKMAKKRALVDGAIALARCSDMFTQDVEDISDPAPEPEPQNTPPPTTASAPKAASVKQQLKSTPPAAKPDEPKTQGGPPQPWERLEIYCKDNGYLVTAGWSVAKGLAESGAIPTRARRGDLTEADLTAVIGELSRAKQAQQQVEKTLGQPAQLEEAPF